ncbi:MAG: hypothetical protein IJ874_06815 [Ruminococcus sp.]|nr:hypothetical protein [Ruminococcus sp.]
MREMIAGYIRSCELVNTRIHELTEQRNILRKQGMTGKIAELDLERRIRLLYKEQSQMKEIIDHLTRYIRRIEQVGRS